MPKSTRATSSSRTTASAIETAYQPDILGDPYLSRRIELPGDAINATANHATLIRRGEPTHEAAVLYLHGFSDYFYQDHFAQALTDRSPIDFYALDLRRYGRSMTTEADLGDVRDLAEYAQEISAALAIMRSEGHRQLFLLGHSTGGLIATRYAYANPSSLDGLILNSPWYDINAPALQRIASGPLAALIARRDPTQVVSGMSADYGEAIHQSTGGAWNFNTTLKPLEGFPVRAGWLKAIRAAQAEVHRGTALAMPVLMCTSSRSGGLHGNRATAHELQTTDCILDVAHMWREVPRLGEDVTLRTIPGGIHDLALSATAARRDYENTVIEWLNRHLDDA